MAIEAWHSRWDALRSACEYRNASGRWAEGANKPPRFEIDPPATEREVVAVEEMLGCAIPTSFRKVLLEYSSRVCIEWALPEDVRPPETFRHVQAGECRWDLKALPELQKTHRDWIEHCFTGKQRPDWEKSPRHIAYDLVWHGKFAILENGTGDMIAIDVARTDRQPVVYLSHEDGVEHGYWLGSDFEDFVDRLSLLGCVGSEDWAFEPFLSGPRSLLVTNGENAKLWREWFGLQLPVGDVS